MFAKKPLLMTLLVAVTFAGCGPDDLVDVEEFVQTYAVVARVLDPSGAPLGGALIRLKNPPDDRDIFSTRTRADGSGTIQAPEGEQVLIAEIGSVLVSETKVTVVPTADPHNVGDVALSVAPGFRVLVVQASCEQLENVLSRIGFNDFDTNHIHSLAAQAIADSAATLAYLQSYSLVFSDCHCSTEGGAYFAKLSRVYGRYVEAGGKMYGGHYNYFHLQRIWKSSYDDGDLQDVSANTVTLVDQDIASYLGFSESRWPTSLLQYERFSDLPANAVVYAAAKDTNPPVGIVVENHLGAGKFLWTHYHNQDLINDPGLIKIVKYFLYSL